MIRSMASYNLLPYLLTLIALFSAKVFNIDVYTEAAPLYPFNCSAQIQTCNALLYHINNGLQIKDLETFYSVNTSQFKPITHKTKQDFLITVPCSCRHQTDLSGYFYDTSYIVKEGDTFSNVSEQIYSGQAWPLGGDKIFPGEVIPVHLLCGCVGNPSRIVATYTVQPSDTLTGIANQLSANLSEIVSINKILGQNPTYIDVGWVLYVPMEKN